jgi:hypothetical protein
MSSTRKSLLSVVVFRQWIIRWDEKAKKLG